MKEKFPAKELAKYPCAVEESTPLLASESAWVNPLAARLSDSPSDAARLSGVAKVGVESDTLEERTPEEANLGSDLWKEVTERVNRLTLEFSKLVQAVPALEEYLEKEGLKIAYEVNRASIKDDKAPVIHVDYKIRKHWKPIEKATLDGGAGVNVMSEQVSLTKQNLVNALRLNAKDSGEPWSATKVMEFLKESPEELEKRKKSAQGVPTQNTEEYSNFMKFVAQAVCLKRDEKHLAEKPAKRKGKEAGTSSKSASRGTAAAKSQEGTKEGPARRAQKGKKAKKAEDWREQGAHTDQTQLAQTSLKAQEDIRNLLGGLLPPEQTNATGQPPDHSVGTQNKEELEASLQESMAAINTLIEQTKKLFKKALEGAEGSKEEFDEQLKTKNIELKQQLEAEESMEQREEATDGGAGRGQENELTSAEEGQGLWLEQAKVVRLLGNAQTMMQVPMEGLLEDLLQEITKKDEGLESEGEEDEEKEEQREDEDDDDDNGPSPDKDLGRGSTVKE
ncbi:hypothetical protein L7F22_051233 [Adiantum nelumboides]|nr:hypothetical protein [Adiantum nelumboides]